MCHSIVPQFYGKNKYFRTGLASGQWAVVSVQWSVVSCAVILSEAKNLAPGVSLEYEILRRLRLLRMTYLRLGAKKRTPPRRGRRPAHGRSRILIRSPQANTSILHSSVFSLQYSFHCGRDTSPSPTALVSVVTAGDGAWRPARYNFKSNEKLRQIRGFGTYSPEIIAFFAFFPPGRRGRRPLHRPLTTQSSISPCSQARASESVPSASMRPRRTASAPWMTLPTSLASSSVRFMRRR